LLALRESLGHSDIHRRLLLLLLLQSQPADAAAGRLSLLQMLPQMSS
jgi:hypothetical protein